VNIEVESACLTIHELNSKALYVSSVLSDELNDFKS
jgi:hypothetical protein